MNPGVCWQPAGTDALFCLSYHFALQIRPLPACPRGPPMPPLLVLTYTLGTASPPLRQGDQNHVAAPSRPCESLAWYRDAARNGVQDDDRPSWSRWVTGWGMLRAHLSVFAFGMVVLHALNLLLDASANWAGWWILAWMALIGIHAIVVTMLWVLRQWNNDAPDEPLFVPAGSTTASWGLPPDQLTVQETDYRSNSSREDSTAT